MENTAATAGKKILRLNLDETPIRLFFEPAKGSVITRPDLTSRQPCRVRMRASKQMRRASFTHVGIICDSTSLQPFLPQVFLGGHSVILQRDVNEVLGDLPANVYLLRKDNHWADVESLAVVVRLVSKAIKQHLGSDYQPVLLLDTFSAHMAERFLRHCRRAGFWVCMVPASTTWLCQPLDTHVFSTYKRQLERAFRRRQIDSTDGRVSTKDVLQIAAAIARRAFAEKKWSAAFDACGFGSAQSRLGGRCSSVAESLGIARPVAQAFDEDIVRSVIPKRRKPLIELLRPQVSQTVLATATASSNRAIATRLSVFGADEVEEPWSKRLRSSAASGSGAQAASVLPPTATASTEAKSWPVAQASQQKQRVPKAVPLLRRRSGSFDSQSGLLHPESGKK